MSIASQEWTKDLLGKTLKQATEEGLIGGGSSFDSAPIGNIIAYMGKNAPENYLVCDGSVYEISKYIELANHINKEFGSFNFFGGNGTTTFAVPDLRGEFLRGTGTNSHANQGSGSEVGVHQDGTEMPSGYMTAKNGKIYLPTSVNEHIKTNNYDYDVSKHTAISVFSNNETESSTYDGKCGTFTTRPTNTSVLYCIKYTDADKKDVYSEEERVIGTWIDGKPLYRKVIKGNLPSTYSTNGSRCGTEIVLPIDNVDDYMVKDGFYNHSNGWKFNILSTSANGDLGINLSCVIQKKIETNKIHFSIHSRSGAIDYVLNQPYLIIVEYTKTTD